MILPQQDQVALVLDLDPDLGAGVEESDWGLARVACRAPLISIPAGKFDLAAEAPDTEALAGFVIVSGMICRELSLTGRHLIELLGPGDVLRPTPGEDEQLPIAGPTYTSFDDAVVLKLGANFIACAARWPSLMSILLDRIEQQRHRLAIQELIVHQPRAEYRLLLILWHLSLRWGRVIPTGLHLPLRLTHELLAQLIAAKRPTVTIALGQIQDEGLIERLDDGSLVVSSRGLSHLERISKIDGVPSLGEDMRLRLRSAELILDAAALQAEARQMRRK